MIQKPKGTKDVLLEDIDKWTQIEAISFNTFESYGYKQVRIPTFEYTELFERGVGDTTDVVQKEMYTFEDKGGRSITLRPEGTAGIVRAFIENGLSSKTLPFKVYYAMPMFRYENVQKGRYREFNQIGAELIGSASCLADVEMISMAYEFLRNLKLDEVYLTINSIGCPECRAKYQQALKEFIGNNINDYCSTCKTRFEKNPMRILDCKENKCKQLNEGAPTILDYLCDECKTHFDNVKKALDELNIEYIVDSGIVRGLDYYTKTVFEFIDGNSGLTVLGGGRYDGLVQEFGGQPTPAVGFATGVERLMEMYNANNPELEETKPDLYILSLGDNESKKAFEISEALRSQKYIVEKDIFARSFKAQMKYADKIGAKNLLVIGEEELKTNTAKIKNMISGEEKEVSLDVESIKNVL